MRTVLLATGVAAIAGVAAAHGSAQETLRFAVTRASTPADPVVEIVIWAVFDPADYAFKGAFFDIEATSGTFFDTECIPMQPGLCSDPGPRHLGPVVKDISVAQFHLPSLGFFANRCNPIAVLKTKWRPVAPVTEDTGVGTHTRAFVVFVDETGASESRLDSFTEGAAIIRVRQCYTDCDGNDEVDFLDFLCFQDAFATGDHYADCDANGELDVFDFLCFQNEFATGCP